MTYRTSGALARKHLDIALLSYREAAVRARPPLGWVRAIRDALGLTTRQLAARMGVSQPTVLAVERGEVAGTVSLNTLRQAAAAMDCQIVYALVPNASLEEIVQARARKLAEEQLARASHTMRLEGQGLSERDLLEERERLTQMFLEGRASRLWESA